ncbi:MAG TPA: GTPase [Gemmataceae bacterium]|jgi:energy-coupling factor transporter ATP-binding protein EcfA2|nr:GTPase [Gemmataceae bacterium]
MTDASPTAEPLLRTLSPLLHALERDLRGWLDGAHRQPLSLIARAALEGMARDLGRQSDALDVERPLLIVMLMGGTGVGKSTLLNALAGGAVAQASFTRPTTRDPVVYYHESVKPDRFDEALRHCRLVPHDRPNLQQKIIVDTPDLDSNDIANRDKLIALLPVADIVLYVGSQEKYHDRLGWDLFKEQRKRRAFAFVLNKWDRCLHSGALGLRPDQDLLRDLKDEGFAEPRLFRTMAQAWVDAPAPSGLPAGEQFAELRDWLELGLTRLEIEAVKARGVGQLLAQLDHGLDQARPSDLTAEAERTRTAWDEVLREEADTSGTVLVSTLEPYSAEIEHHFRVEGQQKFRGLMSAYLKLTTKLRYAGTSLRDKIPLVPRMEKKVETPTNWNLAAFAHECTRVAGERVLNQRAGALVNRLLVEADRQRFPLPLLNGPTNEAARTDWQVRYDRALMEALAEVERIRTRPRGIRKLLHVSVVTLSNILPELVFVASFLLLLWRFFDPQSVGYKVTSLDLLLPFALTLFVLVVLQLLSALLLPVRWSSVRDEFHRQLVSRLETELAAVYGPIPGDTAAALLRERAKVDELLTGVREVRAWLETRQTLASVAGLYGD